MLYSYNDRKHYQDESSQSSVEDEDQHGKATSGYGRLVPQKQQNNQSQSEQEESSMSEEEEDTRKGYEKQLNRSARKVEVEVKEDSESEEEDSSDSSIDEIQKRMRKFERDLQIKIERNKKQTAMSQKPAGCIDRPNTIKSASSPPLPKKQQPKSKVTQPIIIKEARPAFEEVHRIQQQQQQREQPLKPLPPLITKNLQQPLPLAKQSPKKKSREKKQAEEKEKEKEKEKKKRTESKGIPKNEPTNVNDSYAKKLHKANQQIDELSKAMQELKKQNKRLRQQVSSKSRHKKASLQVQKLKQISSQANNVKLEKQIQLLKIIEGLQTKLKKSIAKKLNKSRVGSTSAALLHKGLPSSLIN